MCDVAYQALSMAVWDIQAVDFAGIFTVQVIIHCMISVWLQYMQFTVQATGEIEGKMARLVRADTP